MWTAEGAASDFLEVDVFSFVLLKNLATAALAGVLSRVFVMGIARNGLGTLFVRTCRRLRLETARCLARTEEEGYRGAENGKEEEKKAEDEDEKTPEE